MRARAQWAMGKEKWWPIDARTFGQGKRNGSRAREPVAYGLRRTSPQMPFLHEVIFAQRAPAC